MEGQFKYLVGEVVLEITAPAYSNEVTCVAGNGWHSDRENKAIFGGWLGEYKYYDMELRDCSGFGEK